MYVTRIYMNRFYFVNGSILRTLSTSTNNRPRLRADTITTMSLVVSFVVMCLFFMAQTEFFFTFNNLGNLARTLAVVGITAIGMTLVIHGEKSKPNRFKTIT